MMSRIEDIEEEISRSRKQESLGENSQQSKMNESASVGFKDPLRPKLKPLNELLADLYTSA